MSPGFFSLLFCFTFAALSEQRGTWNASDGNEYYVSLGNVSKSYDDSQRFCNEKGGQLALVKTESIHNFIKTLVSNGSGKPYGFFIGLRNVFGNKTYEWTDGSYLNESWWKENEPNEIGNELCVIMGQRGVYEEKLEWRDVMCNVSNGRRGGFVCQRKIELSTTIPTTVGHTSATDLPKVATFVQTTVESASSPAANSPGGNPEFLISIVASVGVLLFIIIVVVIFCILYRRRKLAKDGPNVEAVAEPRAGDVEQEYAAIGETNNQAGAPDGEYATLSNLNPPSNSEHSTLNLETSTSRYKAPPSSSQGASEVERSEKQESNKGYKVAAFTTLDDKIREEYKGPDLPNTSNGDVYATIPPKNERSNEKVKSDQHEVQPDAMYSTLENTSVSVSGKPHSEEEMYDVLERANLALHVDFSDGPNDSSGVKVESGANGGDETQTNQQNCDIYAVVKK